MVSKRAGEYERFDDTMKRLIQVSHSEIRAKLDAEKKEKKATKRKGSKREKEK